MFRICRKALKKQICKNFSNPLVISLVSICLRTKSPDNVKASLLFIITRRTMRKKLFQLSMVSVMITWFWMLNGPNPLGRNYEIQYEFLFQCKSFTHYFKIREKLVKLCLHSNKTELPSIWRIFSSDQFSIITTLNGIFRVRIQPLSTWLEAAPVGLCKNLTHKLSFERHANSMRSDRPTRLLVPLVEKFSSKWRRQQY